MFASFPEVRADVLKGCLVPPPSGDTIAACVTSFPGYTGLGDALELRQGFSDEIDDYVAGNTSYEELRRSIAIKLQNQVLSLAQPGADDPIRSVDVSFRRGVFHNVSAAGPQIPTHSATSSETTRFNACLSGGTPVPEDNVAGDDYYAYAITVHEAGHALGLSALNKFFAFKEFFDVATTYQDAHPTIPDSVMNYDNMVSEFASWVPGGDQHSEPDCFPHPFDVMAIYALYQSK